MFTRYVAIGDSQSEGLNDGDDLRGYRGWADRLADRIAEVNPDLQYANLAIRGRLARQVREEQLAPALAMEPDLASVVAGVNDLLRPKFDPAVVAGELETMFAALTASGARVITMAFPTLGAGMPGGGAIMARISALNTEIRAAAARHGVAVIDLEAYPVSTDPRLWSWDRLHLNADGHDRLSAAAASVLGLPDADLSWQESLGPLPPTTLSARVRADVEWVARFLGPWLGRRLRGTSSGAGRTAKRPELTPVR
ncbi:SGNH/GDSL hydrolase family protein [Rhodococcus spelaei]|uniref:SGNH/GDSL hydrolase family protein n=1 Tax=Rhodococcus spelaei TaxID=2546320 RepID=A0A541B1X0_9NOCA|nr:SGNH/GDSL hydrolase family protein [Rhodococcus spelaei]TQF66308.1 SGNH/GDSL hydrolase family protein [Rhodococcus spelaei]